MATKQAKRPTTKTVQGTVAEAINIAYSTIEELKDELQNWLDNMPENVKGGDKASTLESSIGDMESDSEPGDIPDCIADVSVSWMENIRSATRATRRDNAVAAIDAVISECEEQINRLNELEYSDSSDVLLDENAQEVDPNTYSGPYPVRGEGREEQVGLLETLRDDLDSAKGNWENVEFPGLFG
jgi:hypothetical protein